MMALWTTLTLMNFPDIVGFQESHFANRETENKFEKLFRSKYRTFLSRGSQGSKGTGILIGVNVPFKLLLEIEDVDGRYTILKGLLFGELVSLVSIYAPCKPKTRSEFFNNLSRIGLRGMLYLMGDYNSVIEHKLDRLPKWNPRKQNWDKSKEGGDEELIDFMRATDVVDPWRERNPEEKLFSWENGRRFDRKASRIDMIAVSRAVRKKVLDIQYWDSGGLSDHSLVWLKINCGEKSMGRGLFCIKPFVYSEREFIDSFNDLIEKEKINLDNRLKENWRKGNIIGEIGAIQRELDDGGDTRKGLLLKNLQLDGKWWENFKNKVRSIAIRVQKNCRIRDSYEYGVLQRELAYCSGRDRNRLKGKVNKKLREMTVKEIFEQRLEDLEFNEKCNSTFLKRVSEKGRKQYLECVVTPEGREIEDRVGITDHLHGKFSELFEEVEASNEFDNLFFRNLPKLSEMDLDGEDLEYDDMEVAIGQMKPGKSPGICGIGIEFYKLHFRKFGHWFTSMFNNCVKNGEVPESWEMAILKLIPKSEGVPSFENLRPISQICVDKKIGAKGLANKIKQVLPKIIDEHQTGGIGGRDIRDNTLLIHLLIQFYLARGLKGFILSIDSRKAFDKVIRKLLWRILKMFGFPDKVIDQIKVMYVGAKSKLVINGFLSKVIPCERGVRQGCPLSSMLFALFVEPLAIAVRREYAIFGFKLPMGSEIKMVQHSDDMNFLVTNMDSVLAIIRIIEAYGKTGGTVINKGKSFIIQIGGEEEIRNDFRGIKIKKEGEFGKILGFMFGKNVNEYREKNWQLVKDKCMSVINLWKGEMLSYVGKMIVLNTKIIPKINYVLGVMEMDEETTRDFEKMICDFLWSNKKFHAKPFTVLSWPKHRGGLGIASLRVKNIILKLKLIQQFFNRAEDDWKNNAIHILMRFHMDFEYRLKYEEVLPERGGGCCDIGPEILYGSTNFYTDMLNNIEILKSLEDETGKKIDKMDKKWLGDKLEEKFYREERGKKGNWIMCDEWDWTPAYEKKMWDSIFHPFLEPKIQAFGWRVAHGIVLTKYRISNKKLVEEGDGLCSCCSRIDRNEKETIEHMLIDCWVAKLVWDKINNALFRAGMTEIERTPEKIIARRGLGDLENFILAETIWQIWCMRFFEEKEGDRRTWGAAIFRIKSRLNLRKYLDLKAGKSGKWEKMEVFLRNLGVT